MVDTGSCRGKSGNEMRNGNCGYKKLKAYFINKSLYEG